MNKLSTRRGVRLLPLALRLRLARFALWRLKHGSSIAPTLMLLGLVGGSGALGYALALQQQWPVSTVHADDLIPGLAAANNRDSELAAQAHGQLAQELGRLQSEIVSLRVLFLRLAEVAQIDDGEFDLDMDFSPLKGSLQGSGVQNHFDESRQPAPDDARWYPEEMDGSITQRPAGRANRNDGSVHGEPVTTGSNGPRSIHQRNDELSKIREPATARAALAVLEVSFPLVKQTLVHMSEQAGMLESVYRERRMAHDFRVSGLPVAKGHITSRYGYRVNPLTGRRQLHRGLDLAGEAGSRVMALADGIVTFSGRNGGYGNLVELEHTGGYRTRYAHNHSLLVPIGARVKKGQLIATMGSTGRSTGTHLHVEVRRNGQALDPQLYIR